MGVALAVSILFSIVVGTVVSLRVLAIARRTRQLPELAVGVGLLSYALSQVSLVGLRALGEDGPLVWNSALLLLRICTLQTTLIGLSGFTLLTFGRTTRWRQALAAGIVGASGCAFVVLLHGLWSRLDGGPMAADQWSMLPDSCFALMFAWMGAESLRYFDRMRRRARLGLADPLLANRFLLWGGGAVVSSLCVVALIALAASGSRVGSGSAPLAALVTFAGLVNALVWWLSFTPPRWYAHWMRAASEEPARG